MKLSGEDIELFEKYIGEYIYCKKTFSDSYSNTYQNHYIKGNYYELLGVDCDYPMMKNSNDEIAYPDIFSLDFFKEHFELITKKEFRLKKIDKILDNGKD